MFMNWLKDDSGQAIVEFLLLTGAIVGVVLLLRQTLKEMTVKLWALLAKKIAASCANVESCPPKEFDL